MALRVEKGVAGALWTTFFERRWPECQLYPPSTDGLLAECETELAFPLPAPLAKLLSECDGVTGPQGEPLIFPLEELVGVNVDMWLNHDYEGVFMPFESLLFFGADKLGNLFAYPVLGERPDKSKIFKWRKDTDSRVFYADGLEQYFYKQWKCYEAKDSLFWDRDNILKDLDDFRLFAGGDDVDFAPHSDDARI
jgi:hypothetical protein